MWAGHTDQLTPLYVYLSNSNAAFVFVYKEYMKGGKCSITNLLLFKLY
jgi:hypothetical protein